MAIKNIKTNKDPLFRVFCEKCGKHSNSSHEDPGDVAIRAKKERFVTVLATEPTDPMLWYCGNCSDLISNIQL